MVKIRFALLLLLAAIVTGGCGGTKIPNQRAAFHPNILCENHVFSGVVLLALENAR
jgi:hypothetical protein